MLFYVVAQLVAAHSFPSLSPTNTCACGSADSVQGGQTCFVYKHIESRTGSWTLCGDGEDAFPPPPFNALLK